MCAASATTRFIVLAVASLVSGIAAEAHPGAGPSVAEIRDTLQNLLRSVTDEGDKVEDFFRRRTDWCDSTLEDFESKSQVSQQGLVLLGSDLKEHEASLEEAQGTIQQVQADITLVQHTLNQTQEMHKVLRQDEALVQSSDALLQEHGRLLMALVENKKQTLQSLQGELDVVVPTLSQLEARVVETKHRINDRIDSTNSERDFVEALNVSCSNSTARRDAQTADHDGIVKSLQEAMDALGQIGDLAPRSLDVASAGDTGSTVPALSFVEMESTMESEAVSTESDLIKIFSDPSAPAAPLAAELPRLRRQHAARAHEAVAALEVPSIGRKDRKKLRPQIKATLAQLKSEERKAPDQQEWCTQERTQNELALRLAQASIGELTAEIDAHTEAETALKEEIGSLNGSIQAVATGTKNTLNSTSEERSLINSKLKNSALAVRIIAQATAILVDLQASGALSGGAKEQAAGRAEAALKSAKADFESQARAVLRMRSMVQEESKEVERASAESVRTQKREHLNLESLFDSHVSLRSRLEETKRMHETEVKEATTYLANLDEQCKTNVNSLQEQERKTEMRALDDAQQVLAGKRMVYSDLQPTEKDGLVEHRQTPEQLSPMERAAAEMGISVDSA